MNTEQRRATQLQLKVCGIRDLGNAMQVAELKPNMMGFILYEKSVRFISLSNAASIAEQLPKAIKKVAVVVNPTLDEAIEIAASKAFDYLQLHGNESTEFCRMLSKHIGVIKAFAIGKQLPSELEQYAHCCDYFLFDTQCSGHGGSGRKFDHSILKDKQIEHPFLISGGIDTQDIESIGKLRINNLIGIDVNSKFETQPGIKDIQKLRELTKTINHV